MRNHQYTLAFAKLVDVTRDLFLFSCKWHKTNSNYTKYRIILLRNGLKNA